MKGTTYPAMWTPNGDPIKHFNAELTRGCNQACIGCFNYSGVRLPRELSVTEWSRAIDIMKGRGAKSALYTGGEVMTRPDIFDILSYSLAAGVETCILSNGYGINEGLSPEQKEIIGHLKRAQISLNSGDPAYHNHTRGRSWAWREAMKAIGFLRGQDIPVEISCTLFPEREGHVEGVAHIAYVTGSKVIIRPFVERERGFEKDDRSLAAIETLKWGLEKEYGPIFINDFAQYVPVLGQGHDRKVAEEGIVTIEPQGRIRGTAIGVLDLAW